MFGTVAGMEISASEEEMPSCPQHENASVSLRRIREGKRTRTAIYRCVAENHYFSVRLADLTKRAKPVQTRKNPADGIACPKPAHADAVVAKAGTRKDGQGRTWQRYSCRRTNSQHHTFSVLIDDNGSVLTPDFGSLRFNVPERTTFEPGCSEQAGAWCMVTYNK